MAGSRMPRQKAAGKKYAGCARFFQQIAIPPSSSNKQAIGVFTASATGK
jgi:hypothetical protein